MRSSESAMAGKRQERIRNQERVAAALPATRAIFDLRLPNGWRTLARMLYTGLATFGADGVYRIAKRRERS